MNSCVCGAAKVLVTAMIPRTTKVPRTKARRFILSPSYSEIMEVVRQNHRNPFTFKGVTQVTIMALCITSDACDTWDTLLQLETEEHVREALRNGIGDLGRRETG